MSPTLDDPRVLRGLEKQLDLRRARLAAGEKPLGWKVGFGTPAAMEQLGTDAPLVGFLTDRSLLPSGGTVSLAGWTHAALEPEIAVYLGRDLAGSSDSKTTRAAVAAVGPAIELADIDFVPEDVEAILAGNIYHRHVIIGARDDSRAGCVLDGLVGHVYRQGTEIAAITDPQAATGDLVNIIGHLANQLAVVGERLRAGEIIITGSIVPPIPVTESQQVSFTLDPLEAISISLAV